MDRDIEVRKVVQDVFLYVLYKHGIITYDPNPDLRFIPEITDEMMNNLCIAVWFQTFRNQYRWRNFILKNFNRMSLTPKLFANYLYYLCYILKAGSYVYINFFSTLSLTIYIVVHFCKAGKKGSLNACVDLFCEFYEKELRSQFQVQGRWESLNSYLEREFNLAKYRTLVSDNIWPSIYLLNTEDVREKSLLQYYQTHNEHIEDITQMEIEGHREIVRFAKSVEYKLIELYRQRFTTLLKDFMEVERQLEELYWKMIYKSWDGMVLLTDEEIQKAKEMSFCETVGASGEKASKAGPSCLQKDQGAIYKSANEAGQSLLKDQGAIPKTARKARHSSLKKDKRAFHEIASEARQDSLQKEQGNSYKTSSEAGHSSVQKDNEPFHEVGQSSTQQDREAFSEVANKVEPASILKDKRVSLKSSSSKSVSFSRHLHEFVGETGKSPSLKVQGTIFKTVSKATPSSSQKNQGGISKTESEAAQSSPKKDKGAISKTVSKATRSFLQRDQGAISKTASKATQSSLCKDQASVSETIYKAGRSSSQKDQEATFKMTSKEAQSLFQKDQAGISKTISKVGESFHEVESQSGQSSLQKDQKALYKKCSFFQQDQEGFCEAEQSSFQQDQEDFREAGQYSSEQDQRSILETTSEAKQFSLPKYHEVAEEARLSPSQQNQRDICVTANEPGQSSLQNQGAFREMENEPRQSSFREDNETASKNIVSETKCEEKEIKRQTSTVLDTLETQNLDGSNFEKDEEPLLSLSSESRDSERTEKNYCTTCKDMFQCYLS